MNLTGTVEPGQNQIFKFYLLTPHRDANRGVRSVRCYLEAVNEKKKTSRIFLREMSSMTSEHQLQLVTVSEIATKNNTKTVKEYSLIIFL